MTLNHTPSFTYQHKYQLYNYRSFATNLGSPNNEERYQSDPYEAILQQNVLDYQALNEKIRMYFKNG